jgi:hypothetical protein
MQVHNLTGYHVEDLLELAVEGYDHACLRVEIKHCPEDSRRSISGTYYRFSQSAPDGLLIRLRINRKNRYPVTVPFKTSEYFKKSDSKGRETTYQRLRSEEFTCPEHLLVAIFLHEFSHYLDHVEGRNGRYKQTKADRFAVDGLIRLGIVCDGR